MSPFLISLRTGDSAREPENSVREDAHPLTQGFETDCVAGVRGIELRYPCAADVFEISR